MADTYIGELNPGGTAATTDKIPVERELTPGVPQNVYVTVASAGTKAASDGTKSTVASVAGPVPVGHLAVFTDTAGTVGDGGEVGGIILNAPALTPVLTTDLIPVVRGGQIYLATVARVLAAQPPPGAGGQLNFSTAGNSGLLAGVM